MTRMTKQPGSSWQSFKVGKAAILLFIIVFVVLLVLSLYLDFYLCFYFRIV